MSDPISAILQLIGNGFMWLWLWGGHFTGNLLGHANIWAENAKYFWGITITVFIVLMVIFITTGMYSNNAGAAVGLHILGILGTLFCVYRWFSYVESEKQRKEDYAKTHRTD